MKPGYTYLMKDRVGLTKIGNSVNPTRRKRQLETHYGSLDIIAKVWSPDCETIERNLHYEFRRKRLNRGSLDGGTEWFSLSIPELAQARIKMRKMAFSANIQRLKSEAVFLIVPIIVFVLIFCK